MSAKGQLHFENAGGALKMYHFKNATVPSSQQNTVAEGFSDTLRRSEKEEFKNAVAEVNLAEQNYNIQPSGRPTPRYIAPTQTGEAPKLTTMIREENRIKQPKAPKRQMSEAERKLHAHLIKPEDVAYQSESIEGANGSIKIAVNMQVPIVKTQNPKPASDVYFRGADIFEDYDGCR